jgi:hypothetical protein
MTHLHSFTITNEAHEIINNWPRGYRSGNVSNAIVMHEHMKKESRSDFRKMGKLESSVREMEQNIMRLQDLLTRTSIERDEWRSRYEANL